MGLGSALTGSPTHRLDWDPRCGRGWTRLELGSLGPARLAGLGAEVLRHLDRVPRVRGWARKTGSPHLCRRDPQAKAGWHPGRL